MIMRAHLAYLKYVLRHKWFVYQWCRRVGNVSLWRSIIHDWTKFLPCEWSAYVQSFYNEDGSKRDWKLRTEQEKAAFNAAWNHHQKVNKHHWQYWALINDSDEPKIRPLAMPLHYASEMVGDWCGAGQAITGKCEVWTWYANNRDKIILHDDTRRFVESLVTFLKAMADERVEMEARAKRLGFSV